LSGLFPLDQVDGLASKAIAKKVGDSDDSVRTKLSRVRKQLRACVEKGASK
jgi:DNA-directed RNA polymerase specialized sigma24 family protein